MDSAVLLQWIVPCVAIAGAASIYGIFSIAARYTGEDMNDDRARSSRIGAARRHSAVR